MHILLSNLVGNFELDPQVTAISNLLLYCQHPTRFHLITIGSCFGLTINCTQWFSSTPNFLYILAVTLSPFYRPFCLFILGFHSLSKCFSLLSLLEIFTSCFKFGSEFQVDIYSGHLLQYHILKILRYFKKTIPQFHKKKKKKKFQWQDY